MNRRLSDSHTGVLMLSPICVSWGCRHSARPSSGLSATISCWPHTTSSCWPSTSMRIGEPGPEGKRTASPGHLSGVALERHDAFTAAAERQDHLGLVGQRARREGVVALQLEDRDEIVRPAQALPSSGRSHETCPVTPTAKTMPSAMSGVEYGPGPAEFSQTSK